MDKRIKKFIEIISEDIDNAIINDEKTEEYLKENNKIIFEISNNKIITFTEEKVK